MDIYTSPLTVKKQPFLVQLKQELEKKQTQNE